MRVWLLKDGEYLPVQKGGRPMRNWNLSEELLQRGHTVDWWASTFSHQLKTLLYDKDSVVEVAPGFKLMLLHCGSYKNNISIRRYMHHRRLANAFARVARGLKQPDVIVASFPIIELAYEAVRYAQERDVPIIVDVRDLWPDIIVDRSPVVFRRFVKIALHKAYVRTGEALTKADSITAISRGCLSWAQANARGRNDKLDRVFYNTGFHSQHGTVMALGNSKMEDLRCRVKGMVVFTFVGSFGHSYELKLICDAAARLKESGNKNAHFVLAGSGEQYKDISRRTGNLTNVTLTGQLSAEEVGALLSFSNVGLIPCLSVPDAMPNKVFEYLAAGLPVISSLIGEMEGIIRDNNIGFSYAGGDVSAFVAHVERLSGDASLARQQGENAKRLFDTEFRAEAVYSAFADHVESLAASGRNK